MYNNDAQRCLTGEVRLSYANLDKPRQPQGGVGDAKYSATLLIPKTDTATIADFRAAIQAAANPWLQSHGLPPFRRRHRSARVRCGAVSSRRIWIPLSTMATVSAPAASRLAMSVTVAGSSRPAPKTSRRSSGRTTSTWNWPRRTFTAVCMPA